MSQQLPLLLRPDILPSEVEADFHHDTSRIAEPRPDPAQRGFRGESGARNLRELIAWCLPALIIGAALRIAVTFSMPYGYVQYDSADYLITPRYLITEHTLHIHKKHSFVSPLLFSVPFLLPVPALLTIPAGQHFLGMLGILVMGAIVRIWFQHWKWFILPATVFMGANPMVVWYEHTLLGESQYLVFILVATLFGSLWYCRPSAPRFGWFMASLVLVTGTRHEGKLLFLASIALVVFNCWGKWKPLLIYGLLACCLTGAITWASSGRVVSGLLASSLIGLAPDHIQSAPGLEPYLLPVRDEINQRFSGYPGDLVKASTKVNQAIDDYLKENPKLVPPGQDREDVRDQILRDLGLEILRKSPVRVLLLPLIKFRLAVDGWSAYCWNEHFLHFRQWQALTTPEWMAPSLSKGLTGATRTPDELRGWVRANYHPERIEWFQAYQTRWNNAALLLRTPDLPLKAQRWVHDFFGGVPGDRAVLPGLPYYYPLALLGVGAVVFGRRQKLRGFHFFWAGAMLVILYLAHLIGVTNARYRFGYCPLFLLYFLLFLEGACNAWRVLGKR